MRRNAEAPGRYNAKVCVECTTVFDNPNMVRQARWRWSQPKPFVLPTCEAPQRHASHSFVGRRGGFAARLRAAGMPVPTRLERRSCSRRSCSGDEVSRPGVHWCVPCGRAPKTRARRPSAQQRSGGVLGGTPATTGRMGGGARRNRSWHNPIAHATRRSPNVHPLRVLPEGP
jgi:hypothetical protein